MSSRGQNSGQRVIWAVCRGINDFDAPHTVADDMAVSAPNMSLVKNALGHRRFGSSLKTLTGDSFTGYSQLARFVPGQSEAAAELHIVSDDATPKILKVAGGSAATNLTLTDNISTRSQDSHFIALNGKHYIAYDSPVNRTHVYDPAGSTTTVRRVGLAAPDVPTLANGGGAGVAIIRYYRIQGRVLSGSNVRRKSNLGTVASFTPGANGVTVTAPAFSEGETHWVVYGSADNVLFYKLSTEIVVATTTYLDNATPSTYADNEAAPEEGAFTPPPSYKFLATDGNRLLGFGVWETSTGSGMPPKNGRVYFSPVLDTTDTEDDERVSNTLTIQGWIDLARNAGGEDRAIIGPIDGNFFVFQSRGMWMLIPTTNATRPFRRVQISKTHGAVNQWSTFEGEDEYGNPCVYWLDPDRGPCRYGVAGLQWLGYDVQTQWAGVNHAATNRVAVGGYDPNTRECKWFICTTTGGGNDPDTGLIFKVHEGIVTPEGVRKGWVTWSGDYCKARAFVMFSETFGASMSIKQKPYVGAVTPLLPAVPYKLLRGEDSAVVTDDGGLFTSSITSKAWDVEPLTTYKAIGRCYAQALAAASSGVPPELNLLITRNYGDLTGGAIPTSTVTLTQLANESRVMRHFEDLQMTGAYTFQMTITDFRSQTATQRWTLDRVIMLIDPDGGGEVGNVIP